MEINLQELIEAKILTPETAGQVNSFYENRKGKQGNKLVIVFGILGALLVGSGIILIIAHNWDDLGKVGQLSVGLLPLLIAQLLAVYAFLKKRDSKVWIEVSSLLVFFAIATGISVVGQVYNLHSNFGRFLLTWIILSLPLLYTHRSALVSLLVWGLATWYVGEICYNFRDNLFAPWYWAVVAVLSPYYINLILKSPTSNFTFFHHWFVAGSLAFSLGMFAYEADELIMLSYITLFSIFVLIGQLKSFQNIRTIANAYLVIGSVGIISLLLFLSFDGYWQNAYDHVDDWMTSREMVVNGFLVVLASALVYKLQGYKKFTLINAKSFAFLAVIILLFIGYASPTIAQLLTNFLILALAIFTIRDGAINQRLGIMNYGLLIVSSLIICRFFDTDLSFIWRGLLFVAVGVGFFVANFWMSKKKKQMPRL